LAFHRAPATGQNTTISIPPAHNDTTHGHATHDTRARGGRRVRCGRLRRSRRAPAAVHLEHHLHLLLPSSPLSISFTISVFPFPSLLALAWWGDYGRRMKCPTHDTTNSSPSACPCPLSLLPCAPPPPPVSLLVVEPQPGLGGRLPAARGAPALWQSPVRTSPSCPARMLAAADAAAAATTTTEEARRHSTGAPRRLASSFGGETLTMRCAREHNLVKACTASPIASRAEDITSTAICASVCAQCAVRPTASQPCFVGRGGGGGGAYFRPPGKWRPRRPSAAPWCPHRWEGAE